jgi:hypothetical protein
MRSDTGSAEKDVAVVHVRRALDQSFVSEGQLDFGELVERHRTRESYFSDAEAAIAIARRGGALSDIDAIDVGYRVACIHPGSLNYLDLLREISNVDIRPSLWACYFSGQIGDRRRMTIDPWFFNVRRRLCHALSPVDCVLDRPQCDIAFDELESLSLADRGGGEFVRNSGNSVAVELLPHLVGLFPNELVPTRKALADDRSSAIELSMRRVQDAVAQLGQALKGEVVTPPDDSHGSLKYGEKRRASYRKRR